MAWRWCCLVFFLSSSHAANILVTAPFGGSHLTSIWDVAVVLADAGHNITFVSLEKGSLDKLRHDNITGYIMKEHSWAKGVFHDIMNDNCTYKSSKSPSRHMLYYVSSEPGCMAAWGAAYANGAAAFRSNEFDELLESTKFDVLIPELTDVLPISIIGAGHRIPTIVYIASVFGISAKAHGNYPFLACSEPGIVLRENFDVKPSFLDRFIGFFKMFFIFRFVTEPMKHVGLNYEKYGVTPEEAKSSIQLYLMNDHMAFTFPTLHPPYLLQTGAMKYLKYSLQPLPDNIESFILEDKPLIYMSFGTYVEPDFAWTQILFAALGKMNVKVILKLKNKNVSLPKNFLPLSWVPQVDLLASGKVDFFISHCGNNGRIETSYFGVPVLCVPLFADQYLNAELLKFNGFGRLLIREDITSEDRVISSVSGMLEDLETFRRNLRKASFVIKNDPAKSNEKLLFYIDYLVNFGNLDFLHNKVLRQQSMVEVYNLDVLAVIGGMFILLLAFVLFILCAVWRKFYQVKCNDSSAKKTQ